MEAKVKLKWNDNGLHSCYKSALSRLCERILIRYDGKSPNKLPTATAVRLQAQILLFFWHIVIDFRKPGQQQKKHLPVQAERYGRQQPADITETKLSAPRLDSLIAWFLVLLPCWETSSPAYIVPDASVISTGTYADRMLMSGHKSQICSLANMNVHSFS